MTNRTLTATCRLQLHKGFTLRHALSIVGYLDKLGVSHIYSSPILTARPGSTHGYDVADPTAVNPELGDDRDRLALIDALHRRGMGFILDIVPNHMGTGPSNPYWMDVLRNGERSRFARWFDIDWSEHRGPRDQGRVMVPVLGDDLDAAIARDEIGVIRENGDVRLKYFENTFPLAPETVKVLPAEDIEEWGKGEQGRARLTNLIDNQHYLLANWRRAAGEINYRRFFDINELIALRMEDPRVFDETHRLILDWVSDGSLDALRIDHIDGLRDPLGYLERLKSEVEKRRGDDVRDQPFPVFVEKILSPGEELRTEWPVGGTTGYEFLNDLEAIFLDPNGAEMIEESYRELVGLDDPSLDFMEIAIRGKMRIIRTALKSDMLRLNGLLAAALSHEKGAELSEIQRLRAIAAFIAALPVYRTYIDRRIGDLDEADVALVKKTVTRAKKLRGAPKAAVDRIAKTLLAGAGSRRDPAEERDDRMSFIERLQQTSGPATAKGIEDTALYQYVPIASLNEVGGDPARPLDKAVETLHEANALRAERWPRNLLCTNTHDTKRSADVRARIDVLTEMPEEWATAVRRWRAMHREHRTVVEGRRVPDANTEYLLYQTIVGVWPLDAAARRVVPDGAALASLRERVEQYMLKAVREAKMRTSWTDQNEAFEGALKTFIGRVFESNRSAPFRREVADLAGRIARPGLWNALSRVAVHLTAPGTPDVYQGDELWNFSLVDPDNRRPVDFDQRAAMLRDLDARFGDTPGEGMAVEALGGLVTSPEDGRIKLYLTSRLLRARRARPALFATGAYEPLAVTDASADQFFAFARRAEGGECSITVAPRLAMTLAGDTPGPAPLGAGVGDAAVTLPKDTTGLVWRCALTGRMISPEKVGSRQVLRLRQVVDIIPVALVIGERPQDRQRGAGAGRQIRPR